MQPPTTKVLLWVYLICLHLAVAVLAVHVLSPSPYSLGTRIMNVVGNPAAILKPQSPALTYAPPTELYSTLVDYHMRGDSQVLPGRVIFLGDSLIQGLPVSSVADRSVNYGIATDDTAGLIARVKNYQSLRGASALLVSVGVNDLLIRDNDALIENYEKLLDVLPDEPVTLCSLILPIDESVRTEWYGRSSARIREINKRIQSTCETRGHLVIDPAKALADHQGELNSNFHIGDGLHLSPEGNAAWIPVLKRALENALRKQH